MASLHLGAALLINESWLVFGFRRRVAERWRFRVQYMSVKEQMTKLELVPFAKRSESLRYILKQYGVSVENPEENKASSRLGDIDCEETHTDVPSSVIDDSSKMNTTEELPDLRRKEKYRETVSTAENHSGKNHHNLPHLSTGALFTYLLPVLGFCIVCIIGALHRVISRNLENSGERKASQDHHPSSESTRWRSALNDWNEQLGSDEHDLSPEDKVGSANQEATEEVDEAYSRVQLEYKRFLSECGVSES
ncbi:hypothetical protein AALP_AA6G192000 [Arabis alpina]|uniref:Transmembrane protein n=1 Tax=Arabis alpina TaxID=50452 RepID=A0A087GQ86_ARAAL|nr:hypothetical protein AALP_AA6G192000 [Arabis alpina]